MIMKPSEFVDNFAACLQSPEWLPFVAPEYAVVKPKITEETIQRSKFRELGFEFCFLDKNDTKFGHIEVFLSHGVPHDKNYDPKSLVIFDVSSRHKGTPQCERKMNYGREFVRRAVWFAYNNDFEKVRTSGFMWGACSFWLGLGFSAERTIRPSWHLANKSHQDIDTWKKRLKLFPDEVWDFAQTEIGRCVLYYEVGHCGILDFKNTTQRNYVFERLRLPVARP